MAAVPGNTKFHFTHPNHPLQYHSDHQDYICGGCKTSGFGGRFRCRFCNFDLHEYCADCPEKLYSSIHHHLLTLVLSKPNGGRRYEQICDVCRDPVDGLFYQCKECDFDAVHPLCTQLPKELRHVADSNHSLKLQKLRFGSCAVCKEDCSSLWVYGCDICRVNIHPDCMDEPFDSPATRWREPPVPPPTLDRSGTTSRRGNQFAPQQWAAWRPRFPGGGFPWNNGGYYSYGNFGGGHGGAYGYAVPYWVSNYHFVYPNYGFAHHGSVHSHMNHHHHGSVHSNVNVYCGHQASEGVNAAPPPSSSSSGGKRKKTMFALVGRLTLGVVSTVIFGFPILGF